MMLAAILCVFQMMEEIEIRKLGQVCGVIIWCGMLLVSGQNNRIHITMGCAK